MRAQDLRVCVPLDAVVETARSAWVEPWPDQGPWVQGLVNHRGEGLVVMDLRAVLGLGPHPEPDDAQLVVLRTSGEAWVLSVDGADLVTEDAEWPDLDLVRLASGRPSALSPGYAQVFERLQARLQLWAPEANDDEVDPRARPSLHRARRWAQPIVPGPAPAAHEDAMTFVVGGQRYALAMPLVREVLFVPPTTRVPGANPAVAGVCHHSGEILTLVDMGTYLGFGSWVRSDRSRIVVVGRGSAELGLIVDEVSGAAQLDLRSLPEALRWIDARNVLDDPGLYVGQGGATDPGGS